MILAVLKLGYLGAAMAALSDPAWAGPINTLLLVVLAFLNMYHQQAVKAARKDAEAAARVAKEVGAAIRAAQVEAANAHKEQ